MVPFLDFFSVTLRPSEYIAKNKKIEKNDTMTKSNTTKGICHKEMLENIKTPRKNKISPL